MYKSAFLWASDRKCERPEDKLLLILMADWATKEGMVRFRLENLAKRADMHFVATAGALDRLTNKGFFELSRRFDEGEELWVEGRLGLPRNPPSVKKGPARISKSKRERVFARDGYACVVCGSPSDLGLDHKTPRSRGGSNAEENLQTMCRPCNSKKGDLSAEAWREKQERILP
ncbi:MAG: HNH endonuclease [Pseudomonadota bacterium]